MSSSGRIEDVTIIIAAFNALKYTKLCLQSIKEYTPPGYELILVNNGSTDGTKEYFAQVAGARVINNEQNLGFAAGYNRGIEAAKTNFILMLNNDCIVSHNWLTNMLECCCSDPGIGIVGPRANSVPGRQRVEREFGNIEQFHAYTADYNCPDSNKWFPVATLSGFCFLFRKEVPARIGLFDETFGIGTFEDADYCVRARLAGFKLFCAGDVFLYHFSHRTFMENQLNLQEIYRYNKYLFEQKWSYPK